LEGVKTPLAAGGFKADEAAKSMGAPGNKKSTED
jgi:hypothetical protein